MYIYMCVTILEIENCDNTVFLSSYSFIKASCGIKLRLLKVSSKSSWDWTVHLVTYEPMTNGIQALHHRWKKWVNSKEEYIEK